MALAWGVKLALGVAHPLLLGAGYLGAAVALGVDEASAMLTRALRLAGIRR